MFNDEEFSSDTSDEDFNPEGIEIASDDEDFEAIASEGEGNNDDTSLSQKRKRPISKNIQRKKIKKKNPLLSAVEDTIEEECDEKEQVPTADNPQKVDALWADFLADVEEKPKTKPKSETNSWSSILNSGKKDSSQSTNDEPKTSQKTKLPKLDAPPQKVKITKIFEFAGEEVRVEEEVDKDSVPQSSILNTSKSSNTSNSKKPLGLSGVMSLLDDKKTKLSTLEKTKIDWISYKSKEGIQDELKTHLKSKEGYLEKQAFLERADLRQFEIERNMRTKRRGNKP